MDDEEASEEGTGEVSRSGYSEDAENLGLWRGAVDRALRGKRGQAFLREMASALDAMPTKVLVADEVVRDSDHVCALGSVALARKLDVSSLDVYDGDAIGTALGISMAMTREIVFMNDERDPSETDAERWTRMRAWVDEQIVGAK